MAKSHTHIEFWNVDGTILEQSDANAAPFSLKVGEQIILGGQPHQVTEIIDSEPREVNDTVHYRRIVRVR